MKSLLRILVCLSAMQLAGGTDAKTDWYDTSYALVVGIDKYPAPQWPNLSYARKDAEGVAKFLEKQGFQVISLYDEKATKTAIVSIMQNHLARRVNANDRILVFFAGHGYTEELRGRDWGYIVPYHESDQSSAAYISMEELQTLSAKMGYAKHQLFIMDACYGGLLGVRGLAKVDTGIPNYLHEVTKRFARQIITAGGKDQQVLDQGPGEHSVFTGHLIEALEKAFADVNGDGYITFSELTGYLVPKATNAHQTPAPGVLPEHGLGEFVFRSPLGGQEPDFDHSEDLNDLKRRLAESDKEIAELRRKLAFASEFTIESGVSIAESAILAGEKPATTRSDSIVPNDPAYVQQWNFFNRGDAEGMSLGGIGLPHAWTKSPGSEKVVVAVLSTGLVFDHPDIVNSTNIGAGFDMISDAWTANDGDGRDGDPTDVGDGAEAGDCGPGSPARGSSWHGTHSAGLIGAANSNNGIGIAGINWNTTILPVRVMGKCGGTIPDINDGIRWAAGLSVSGAPDNVAPARVILLDFGVPAPCFSSPATQQAINDAVQAGAVVVAPAGNDAQDAANTFPAGCDNVITVAASDMNGKLVSQYSNFGTVVDIMAPGGDMQVDRDNDGNPDGILSTVKEGYAYYHGTSMAAAHVTGVAALILAQEPHLSPSEVRDRITATAIETECPVPCGAGLLNASASVRRQR